MLAHHRRAYAFLPACLPAHLAMRDIQDFVQTLFGDFDGFVHDGLRDSQALCLSSVGCCVRGCRLRLLFFAAVCGPSRLRRALSFRAYVLKHATKEGREARDLAGTEQGEGVVLDGGRPVVLVRVEGV